MTPATGVTEFIAAYGEKCSVIMEQAEDEIAALIWLLGNTLEYGYDCHFWWFALMTEALVMQVQQEFQCSD